MNLFLSAFVTMFLIVDPLGNAAVFAGLTRTYDLKHARRTAFEACALAILILLACGFTVPLLLGFVGISIEAFKMAGGVLLFCTAYSILRDSHADAINGRYIAVFPMAIPLMAGPGCAAAFIVLLNNSHNIFTAIAAMICVEIVALACLLLSARIASVIGARNLRLLARITGIFLGMMSVRFILEGFLKFI
jgi:multiple antibiotic resistance protein